ncbi:MAG: alpha/beta fold hydrolase [Microcoleaceae cyanobacterium]
MTGSNSELRSQGPYQIQLLQPTDLRPELPLLVYLPGMDGTGELLHTQISDLSQRFDVRCLQISDQNRSDWQTLADGVVHLIQQELTQRQDTQVYLCGESFGGCLALQVTATAPELLHHLILVNSASAFKYRAWLQWGSRITQWLPHLLYPVSTMGLLPFLASLGRMTPGERRALINAMKSVSQETSVWRIDMLKDFDVTEDQLQQIEIPTLIVAGTADWLLPSVAEAERLAEHLQNAHITLLRDSGHACLLEADVDLNQILEEHVLGDSVSEANAAQDAIPQELSRIQPNITYEHQPSTKFT